MVGFFFFTVLFQGKESKFSPTDGHKPWGSAIWTASYPLANLYQGSSDGMQFHALPTCTPAFPKETKCAEAWYMSVSSQHAAETDKIWKVLQYHSFDIAFKLHVICYKNISKLLCLWNAFVIVSCNDFSLLFISYLWYMSVIWLWQIFLATFSFNPRNVCGIWLLIRSWSYMRNF